MVHWLRHDRVLQGAIALVGLLVVSQLAVVLLHPVWGSTATDWFLSILAWPELAVVVYLSLRLSHARRPDAPSWWLVSIAVCCYAVARTVWTVDDYLIFHHDIPFPSIPDFLFAFRYPFFFLAILLIPRRRQASPRLLMTLDSVLFLGAAAALAWFFLLGPIVSQSGLSPLARAISLAYPLGGLLVLVGLTLVLLRPSHYWVNHLILGILVAAVVCLILGDCLAVALVLHPNHVFRRGALPDLFWLACDLLIPLAAVVELRLLQRAPPAALTPAVRVGYQWDDVIASLRFFFPLVAAVVASVAILLHAIMTESRVSGPHMFAPFIVSVGLLLFALVRQEFTFLENTRLQREREEARATAQAMRELSRRKDEFLSIVSHEFKTPMASLRGYLELLTRLLARRFGRRQPQAEVAGVAGGVSEGAEEKEKEKEEGDEARAQIVLAGADESVRRLTRLVDDLLDDAQIRGERLALHLEPCDLATIVRAAVEEQQMLSPTRTLQLAMPTTAPVLVQADAMRIGQVVTNYLTNALKFSKEDQAVEVRLEEAGAAAGGKVGADRMARVSVRDEGIGVPRAAQPAVWERFGRIDGNAVQSGSGIGLGLGLAISKHIIEGHHGQVGLDSVPGRGSTFWFTLPIASCTSLAPVASAPENHRRGGGQDERVDRSRPLNSRHRAPR